jgi:MraZ protein
MAASPDFVLGEFTRSLDDRYRLSVPAELAEPLLGESVECALAKERPGCLSLWSAPQWRERYEAGVELVQSKMRAGRLEGRLDEVQQLGRLLSTRHRPIQLGGRSRLVVPEGFREFLGVEPGGTVIVVGAAVCVEIWRADRWLQHLEERMPSFRELFDKLAN